MIKVTVQGGETKEVAFTKDITIGVVLKEAKVTNLATATVSVNGKKAKGFGWKNAKVPDNALVVVTANVGNG